MNELNKNTTQTIAAVGADGYAHHYNHFYEDAAFWVGLSFIIVVVALGKPLYKIAQTLLDKRILDIKNSLKEAKQLELDAKKLLHEYEEKMANLKNEVNGILEKSQKEVSFLKEKSIKKLEDELSRKKQDNEYFIINMHKQLEDDITNIISDKVINSLKNSIKKSFSDKDYDELIDSSIDNIGKLPE